MSYPKDPMILMSYVNTKLRDVYPSFQELCDAEGFDKQEILNTLSQVGFEYNSELNKFW